MAWPYIFESTFDTGDATEWSDGETDTASQLDFPSYRDLAVISTPRNQAPFSGSHCMRTVLTGSTTTAFVKEATSIALGVNNFMKFEFFIGDDFTATVDDFNIFLLQINSGSGLEAEFGIQITASTDNVVGFIGPILQRNVGGTLQKGIWHTVELDITIDSGAPNDGTVDVFITPEGQVASTSVYATQVTGLPQATITNTQLGLAGHNSTTTGTLLFDNFVFDDTRIFPTLDRWRQTRIVTKSGNVFVGPGRVTDLIITTNPSGGEDNTVFIFDTDSADRDGNSNAVMRIATTANDETIHPLTTPIMLRHGCYIDLVDAGTDFAMATVTFDRASAFGSVSSIRTHGVTAR